MINKVLKSKYKKISLDKTRLTFFYGALIVITIAALVWNHFGMNKERVLFPNKSISHHIYSDPQYGGRSNTTVKSSENALTLFCRTIFTEQIHPFCGISFDISGLGEAQDLSSFDEVNVTISSESTEPDTVMFYLVNAERDDSGSQFERTNLRTINAGVNERTIRLPIDSFYVPSWWLLFNPEAPNEGKPNVNNITELRITTGDSRVDRQVKVQISQISIHGKLIKQTTLYLAIIIVWMSVSLIFVLASMIEIRRNARASKKKTAELEKLNSFLHIEKDKFESMAKHDVLTRALNRAGLRPVIDEALVAYRERNTTNSLIMFDIDHFKSVNDTHGHKRGDEILIEMVELINTACRDEDYLARWGGEEFALVCLGTNKSEAILFAEKLRELLNANRLGGLAITCSFGVAQLHHDNALSWFDAADKALYIAKEKGRNQVRAI